MTIEKKTPKGYQYESLLYYKPNPDIYFADFLRHYDLPKTQLLPHQRDTLHFNLLRKGITLDTGYYRMKIRLRVQTIEDTSAYRHDPTGASVPPEDQIKYITSDWIYFKVRKRME